MPSQGILTAAIFLSVGSLLNSFLALFDLCHTLFKVNRQKKNEKKSWGGARPRAGRHSLDPAAKKRQVVVVRMTDVEKTTVVLAAERKRKGLSEWIRETLFESARVE